MYAPLCGLPEGGNTQPVATTFGIFDAVLAPNDEALRFARDVFDTVVDIVDSPFIHIGGDECPRTEWQASLNGQPGRQGRSDPGDRANVGQGPDNRLTLEVSVAAAGDYILVVHYSNDACCTTTRHAARPRPTAQPCRPVLDSEWAPNLDRFELAPIRVP